MVPSGWDLVEAQDICHRISVGIVVKPKDYYVPEGEGVRAFRSANVREGFVEDSNWTYISDEGHQKNKKSILQAGDVLVVRTGYPGTACVVPDQYAGANCIDIIFARPDTERVLPEYLCDFTNSEYGKKQVLDGQGGLAQQHFNVGSYNKLRVPLPPLPEQQKIADILSTWDAAIEKTEALLTTAKAQKRALMQHLLTGRRRFPEFEGQAWKTAKLIDHFDFINGKAFKPDDWGLEGLPIIRIQNLTGSTDSINYFEGDVDEKHMVRDGDFLLSWSATLDTFIWRGSDAVLNQHIFKVVPNTDTLKMFGFHLITYEIGKLVSKVHGTSMKHITKKDLSKITSFFPAIPEQRQITAVLNDAQYDVDQIEADITKLRTEKKALMQQLLTGKRRVMV